MILWAYLNALLSAVGVVVIVNELLRYGDRLIATERFGKGLAASGMFLGIPILLDVEHYSTPFDGWASTLLRLGIIVYIVGRTTRHVRHTRANRRQARYAEDYLRGRGKL
ncbi:hypothetical protein [Sphingomonas sp.]|uniref:hypothetical protein n=1 Tax=Sphingomonas sp. TaxID=28214 RepID=UPI003B3BC177